MRKMKEFIYYQNIKCCNQKRKHRRLFEKPKNLPLSFKHSNFQIVFQETLEFLESLSRITQIISKRK